MDAYDFPSGGWGVLALWGGLFVQASVIVFLVGMAEGATVQSAGMVVGVYFVSMGVYFAIDIAWVMLLELRLAAGHCRASRRC